MCLLLGPGFDSSESGAKKKNLPFHYNTKVNSMLSLVLPVVTRKVIQNKKGERICHPAAGLLPATVSALRFHRGCFRVQSHGAQDHCHS